MIPHAFAGPLDRALTAIDGRELLPAGAVDGDSAQRVYALRAPGREEPLAFGGSVIFRDFIAAQGDPKYNAIFRRPEELAAARDLVGNIRLSEPLLGEMQRMELHDPYTYRHVFVVTSLSAVIARRMGHGADEAASIAAAALLHDFGKSRVPTEILQSSEKLDPARHRQIQGHPLLGYLLLVYYSGAAESLACRVSLLHHERRDGSGYPFGLAQTDDRIGLVTVNDIYDALISRRTYRQEAYDVRGALDLLWEQAEAGRLPQLPVRWLIALNRQQIPDDVAGMPVHLVKRGKVPRGNNYGPQDY